MMPEALDRVYLKQNERHPHRSHEIRGEAPDK
jgi:hypothetical protein